MKYNIAIMSNKKTRRGGKIRGKFKFSTRFSPSPYDLLVTTEKENE